MPLVNQPTNQPISLTSLVAVHSPAFDVDVLVLDFYETHKYYFFLDARHLFPDSGAMPVVDPWPFCGAPLHVVGVVAAVCQY